MLAASSSPQPWPPVTKTARVAPGIRILHLEDNDVDAALVRKLIQVEWPDCQITRVLSRFAYTGELQLGKFDLILSDFSLNGFNGLEALEIAQQRVPDTPFILLSGTIGEERAIEAIRCGARDYVLKDQIRRLTTAIHRTLKESDERQRRYQAERHSRELAGFLNKARDAIVVINLEGRITFWNHGAERLTDWTAAAAANQTVAQLFGASAAGPIKLALAVDAECGEWAGEIEICTQGGQSRLVDFRLSLIGDDQGKPQAHLAICTDLTVQLQAERRIREQAEMLNQAREAIIITDLENHILYWSKGAEQIYGWLGPEVMGRTAEQIFTQDDGASQIMAAREVTRARGEWHGAIRLHDRRGKALVLEMRRTLILDENGQPKAHLSITSDVTEQKRLEEQLHKVQRLENIGLLAAGIAHDLTNMLAPMLMAAPVLRAAVTDPAALRLLDIVEKSAERGTALVRQILVFSQGAAGEPQSVNVRHLLHDIGMLMAETFPKNIKLVELIAPDLWPVKANPSQIHQVLLNLCVNARDAMPQGGELTLRAENCALGETAAGAIEGGRAGDFLLLEVADTGTGIAPDVLARLWEPFVTTKSADKGTGLGLSTTRGIITNHGGFIRLDTAPGLGASFRVYLPAIVSAEDQPPPTTASAPRGNGELILVVDDEAPVRDLIGKLLTRHGYRVLLAGDGAEATGFFAKRATEIRLVVSDLNMPNLDGAMLARVLKRINADVRVLVVSGLSSPGQNRPGFRPEEFTGAFLRKPFKPDDLLAKVHELLLRPAQLIPGRSTRTGSGPV